MNELPILFTGPSVPMVMAGIKTQTRRIANMERLSVDVPRAVIGEDIHADSLRKVRAGRHRVALNPQGAVFTIPGNFGLKPGEFHFRCPLVDGTTSLVDHGNGKPCWTIRPSEVQRLWVRETTIIAPVGWNDGREATARDADGCPRLVQYLATSPDREAATGYQLKATPSIFMPRWASRTNLMPIVARLQHLQDISDEDAIAEGVIFTDYAKMAARAGERPRAIPGWHYGPSTSYDECFYSARYAFANIWNYIHGGPRWNLKPGPSPWDLNPWVWAYTFRKEAP